MKKIEMVFEINTKKCKNKCWKYNFDKNLFKRYKEYCFIALILSMICSIYGFFLINKRLFSNCKKGNFSRNVYF